MSGGWGISGGNGSLGSFPLLTQPKEAFAYQSLVLWLAIAGGVVHLSLLKFKEQSTRRISSDLNWRDSDLFCNASSIHDDGAWSGTWGAVARTIGVEKVSGCNGRRAGVGRKSITFKVELMGHRLSLPMRDLIITLSWVRHLGGGGLHGCDVVFRGCRFASGGPLAINRVLDVLHISRLEHIW
ncbi:hypothetical protein KY285_016482 [Solanum tuberosum]|nr:hypothetical protein KY285_016482 [Solanum tuberosum]